VDIIGSLPDAVKGRALINDSDLSLSHAIISFDDGEVVHSVPSRGIDLTKSRMIRKFRYYREPSLEDLITKCSSIATGFTLLPEIQALSRLIPVDDMTRFNPVLVDNGGELSLLGKRFFLTFDSGEVIFSDSGTFYKHGMDPEVVKRIRSSSSAHINGYVGSSFSCYDIVLVLLSPYFLTYSTPDYGTIFRKKD
jgi:hypothetical protein